MNSFVTEQALVTPIGTAGVMIAAAVVPLLFLGATSFLKLNIIFAILRNALGGGSIPGSTVCATLAAALTWHIMSPTALEMYAIWERDNVAAEQKVDRQVPVKPARFLARASEIVQPLKVFLAAHTDDREREFFQSLEPKSGGAESKKGTGGGSIAALLPAFMLTELKRAFTFGVLLLLPFVVIDVIVANLLIALGMAMVNPVTFTFPMKLLLFVVADGWFLLCENLVNGYS